MPNNELKPSSNEEGTDVNPWVNGGKKSAKKGQVQNANNEDSSDSNGWVAQVQYGEMEMGEDEASGELRVGGVMRTRSHVDDIFEEEDDDDFPIIPQVELRTPTPRKRKQVISLRNIEDMEIKEIKLRNENEKKLPPLIAELKAKKIELAKKLRNAKFLDELDIKISAIPPRLYLHRNRSLPRSRYNGLLGDGRTALRQGAGNILDPLQSTTTSSPNTIPLSTVKAEACATAAGGQAYGQACSCFYCKIYKNYDDGDEYINNESPPGNQKQASENSLYPGDGSSRSVEVIDMRKYKDIVFEEVD